MSRVVRSSPPRSRRPLPNWAFSSSGIARPTSPTSGVSSMSPIGRSVRLGARARSRSTTTRWLTSGKQASTSWPPTGTRPVTTTQPSRRAGSVGRTASVRARRRTSGVRGSVGACVASGSRGRGRAVPSQAGATAVRRMSTTPDRQVPERGGRRGGGRGGHGWLGRPGAGGGGRAGGHTRPGAGARGGAVAVARGRARAVAGTAAAAAGAAVGGRAAGGDPGGVGPRRRERGSARGADRAGRAGTGAGSVSGPSSSPAAGGPPPSAPRRRRRHLRSTGGWHRVPQETPTVADRPRNRSVPASWGGRQQRRS